MLALKEKHLAELERIFGEYCPKAEIWAFGSRIKNESHSGSDLDLAVKNFHENNKSVPELRELLNDSDIPFLIDILDFQKIPTAFQKEILKEYVQIFPATGKERGHHG